MPAKLQLPELDIVAAYRAGDVTWIDLATMHGVSKRTIGRILKRHDVKAVRPAHARPTYGHDVNFFDVIDSEQKAYWLGFIAADGSISRRGRKGSGLTIVLASKDAEHLESFRVAIQATNPITSVMSTNGYPAARLSIWGDAIPDALERHSIVARKSLIHEWPHLTGEMLRHFLRGYFDGDGHIGVTRPKRKSPSYRMNVIGSTPFMVRWREHMLSLGAASGRLYHPHGNESVSVIEYSGNRQVLLMHDYLYSDATVALARKATLPELSS